MSKILAIDINKTIRGSNLELNKNFLEKDVFKIISKIASIFDEVYLITTVTSTERKNALKWLERTDFFKKTSINPSNVFFCFERADKGIFAKALNCTHFIDDRAEVMYNLPDSIFKLLINPEPDELKPFSDDLVNTIYVKSWKEIQKILL